MGTTASGKQDMLPCWTRSIPVWTIWRKNEHLHPCLQELLESHLIVEFCLGFQQQMGEGPSDASPQALGAPNQPQPYLPGLGSGLGIHHLA
uniref:Uncharacterized protein n=1 Tax=Panthera leo TaxID=9689 RepID=A0A8C9D8G6_PANLE